MAEYEMICPVCGRKFVAKQRNRQTCSPRCSTALYRGQARTAPKDVGNSPETPIGYATTGNEVAYMPCADAPEGMRLYRLFRGTLARHDDLVVSAAGIVTSGPLKGRPIRDVLKTADERGWLAYRKRDDGWYAAEWDRNRVTLCGPTNLPG